MQVYSICQSDVHHDDLSNKSNFLSEEVHVVDLIIAPDPGDMNSPSQERTQFTKDFAPNSCHRVSEMVITIVNQDKLP